MAYPFFYIESIPSDAGVLQLNEETSKHIVQVLRMKVGEPIELTDGKGSIYTAEITNDHKKRCEVLIRSERQTVAPAKKIVIAISPVKNSSRFEWFLEKATEIGVFGIVPLICERTEKQHLRLDRLRGILVSAMLQSQQAWLPEILEPVKFAAFVTGKQSNGYEGFQKFIAHCEEGRERQFLGMMSAASSVVLIGPEGDFTPAEIDMATGNGYTPVSLGENRLRTETAGMVAAVLMNLSIT